MYCLTFPTAKLQTAWKLFVFILLWVWQLDQAWHFTGGNCKAVDISADTSDFSADFGRVSAQGSSGMEAMEGCLLEFATWDFKSILLQYVSIVCCNMLQCCTMTYYDYAYDYDYKDFLYAALETQLWVSFCDRWRALVQHLRVCLRACVCACMEPVLFMRFRPTKFLVQRDLISFHPLPEPWPLSGSSWTWGILCLSFT